MFCFSLHYSDVNPGSQQTGDAGGVEATSSEQPVTRAQQGTQLFSYNVVRREEQERQQQLMASARVLQSRVTRNKQVIISMSIKTSTKRNFPPKNNFFNLL